MKKVRISLGCTVMMEPPGDSGGEVGLPGDDKESICLALPPGLPSHPSSFLVCYGSLVEMALSCPLL